MPRKWPELSSVFSTSRSNAKRRGLAFTLTEEDFADLVRRAAGACMITGIPFDREYRSNSRFRPYAPSLDRIDSAQGYIPGNVRLVITAVNVALGDWGSELLDKIAGAIMASRIQELEEENALLRARLAVQDDAKLERGCLSERKDGRWVFSVWARGEQRPRKRRYFYGATPEEAKAKALARRAEWDRP